ncbi:MAG: pseudouridine synthase [Minisyncoccia bacterium]
MLYPIRINKYLSEKKICGRREADDLIRQEKVIINGRVAELGEMVEENDDVSVSGKTKELVYVAYNKPKGIVTHSPQDGETCIADILKIKPKVSPLGRLDKESRGLIILSNDGRITDQLLNPEFGHEKEYEVRVDRLIDDNFIRKMASGVKLDGGYITSECVLEKKSDLSFTIIITEGKRRQIRRMCQALGYDVVDLYRTRIMNIKLNNLQPRHHMMISGEELNIFLSDLGL